VTVIRVRVAVCYQRLRRVRLRRVRLLLRVMRKLFPAVQLGGAVTIKALCGPYPQVL